MPGINRRWLLRSRPQGPVRPGDFEYREQPMSEGPLRDREIRIRNVAFRCSPTHRNWMDPPGNSLFPSMPLGEPVLSAAAGVVLASANEDWRVGDRVLARSGWEDYSTHGPASLAYASKIADGISELEALGRYGLNSLTGYFGLLEVGRPRAGETLVVSAAAGATGSTAAQIGKIKGMRVVGIAGGANKCDWLVRDCGLDAAIDYKSQDVSARLEQLCPGGIDVFYDNVGGDILQAAIDHMARFGRIVLCGQISSYDGGPQATGPRNMMRLVYGSIRMEGFLCSNHASRYGEAIADLRRWTAEGRIRYREDVHYGFETLPSAFMSLFRGENAGTVLVRIEERAADTDR